MDSITIDVFGYEKTINASVQKYAQSVAKEHGITASQVFVRIIKPNDSLRVYLHAGGQLIKELTISELVQFFMGSSPGKSVENKVSVSTTQFLKEYTNIKGIRENQLQILISSSNNGAIVKSFNDESSIGEIPIQFLIKYFKS